MYNSAESVNTAGTRTRVQTLLAKTGQVERAVRVIQTFRMTRRVVMAGGSVTRVAHGHLAAVNLTLSRRIARIRSAR